jgi:ATP-dependent protease ClpP protease subunit
VEGGVLEVLIYGEIISSDTLSMLSDWGVDTESMVSSLAVKKSLDAAAGTYSRIRVRINSPGGNAFEGMAIHSLLSGAGYPVDVVVDGVAASSAAIVAMAGATRTMGPVAMMMVHRAWSDCVGNASDMLKRADTLSTIDSAIASAFSARTGLTRAEIQTLMDAETWLTAQECVDQGFATSIQELPTEEAETAFAMARGFRALNRWHNLPESLRGQHRASILNLEDDGCQCDCKACGRGDCANCSNAECEDANCTDCPMQAAGASNLTLFEARNWMAARGINDAAQL